MPTQQQLGKRLNYAMNVLHSVGEQFIDQVDQSPRGSDRQKLMIEAQGAFETAWDALEPVRDKLLAAKEEVRG